MLWDLNLSFVYVYVLVIQGIYVSMGIVSDGSYGIPEGIVYSFPVTIGADRQYSIVQGLQIDDFSREKMDLTGKELLNERQDAFSFLDQQE